MNEEQFVQALGEAYKAKVWSEVVQSWSRLTIEQQEATLLEFAKIADEHGIGSQEMHDFFHTQSMTHSRTYFYVHTLAGDNDWDKAVEELS
jgi:hypothetical protein